MKKWLRLGLCLGLLVTALTCSALAATDGYTTDVSGTVTYDAASGKYTAAYSGVTAGEQYALLVVKGTPEDYSVSEGTLMYIDQTAASSTISFTFIPKSTPDCVVLLGGKFADGESPKVLGTLIGQGVAVSGSVTLQGRSDCSGATVTLAGGDTYTAQTDASGAYYLDGVAAGSYTLKITMPGYLSYTKNNLEVEDETTVPAKNLLGGDVNADTQVTIADLNSVLSNYMATGSNAADINGDTQVTIADLSIVLSNYMASATVEN